MIHHISIKKNNVHYITLFVKIEISFYFDYF